MRSVQPYALRGIGAGVTAITGAKNETVQKQKRGDVVETVG
jgi:hypothetical protein